MSEIMYLDSVTRDELLNKYTIESGGIQSTGWTKNVKLHNKKTDAEFTGRLHWDSNSGYNMRWDDKMPVENYRPEFEYVLDGITEGDR